MKTPERLIFLYLFTFLISDVIGSSKPNIIFVLTDDQDVTLGGEVSMDEVFRLLHLF